MHVPQLSVIVPAYNEAESMRECLSSLASEIASIHEVIVVDNNSTDGTRAIIDEFVARNSKFSVITEVEQGLIPARDAGFEKASGEVYARIDADTRVGRGWAASIATFFSEHGETYAAGTGFCTFYDAPFQEKYRTMQAKLTAQMRSEPTRPKEYHRLFGSNMAITAAVWREIKGATSRRDDVFEDLDIALCVQSTGAKLALIPGADATISGRRFRTGPISHLRYALCDQRTYKIHGMKREQRSAVVTMIVVAMPLYVAMSLPFRMYDPAAQKFAVSALWRGDRASVRAHT